MTTPSLDQLLVSLTNTVQQVAAAQSSAAAAQSSSDSLNQTLQHGIATLAQRAQAQDAQRAQDLQALSQTVQAIGQATTAQQSRSRSVKLYDTKGFVKPPSFSGQASDWRDWKFKVLMWLDSDTGFAKKVLSAVADEEGEVSGRRLPPSIRNDDEAGDQNPKFLSIRI